MGSWRERDFWIVKVDDSGNEQWNYTYGGTDQEIFRSGVYTSDGGFALTGATFSSGPDQDIWLLKVDGSGNEEWNVSMGGIGGQRGLSLVETSDNGFVISGGHGVWKTNNLGIQEWNNTFGIQGSDFFNNIIQTSDGGFVLSGGSNAHGARGSNDFVIAKVSQDGTFEWITTHGGVEWDNSCCAKAMVETSDGSLLMTGYSESFGDLDGDVWLLKTNSTGGELWNEPLGGPDTDSAEAIYMNDDGSFMIIGSTESQGSGLSDFWLINAKIDRSIDEEENPGFELLLSISTLLILNIISKKRQAKTKD